MATRSQLKPGADGCPLRGNRRSAVCPLRVIGRSRTRLDTLLPGFDPSKMKMLSILRTPMVGRTTFIALLLAAVAVTAVCASPASPAKARRHPKSAVAAHAKPAHPAARPSAHAAGRGVAQKPLRTHRAAAAKAQAALQPCVAPPSKPLPAKKIPQPQPPQPPVTASAEDPTPAFHPASNPAPQVLKKSALAMPAPLFGSRASLVRQNSKTEDEGLERIEDRDDLADRIARKMLVPLPASNQLTVSANLPVELRYCRPWTASFLADMARAHTAQFHRPLNVSSAVRTVEYQKQLMQTNGNAAAAEGDIVSPHLTGATVDITKQGLGRQELGWARSWLLTQQAAGKIDVEEEFHESCFHITVYKSYAPLKLPRKSLRPRPGAPTVAQPANEGSADIAARGQ